MARIRITGRDMALMFQCRSTTAEEAVLSHLYSKLLKRYGDSPGRAEQPGAGIMAEVSSANARTIARMLSTCDASAKRLLATLRRRGLPR